MELSVLAVRLGLPSTASQADVDAKLQELETKAASADGLVQAQADQRLADEKAQKKTLLDAAEQEKKINAKQRPSLEALGVPDLKAFLENQPTIEALSEGLTPGGDGTPKGREKWTYADYQSKDAKAFEKLTEKEQESLIDAHYASEE